MTRDELKLRDEGREVSIARVSRSDCCLLREACPVAGGSKRTNEEELVRRVPKWLRSPA